MITRVFRASVPKHLQQEFEEKFIEVSAPMVRSHVGLVSLTCGRPTKWNPTEFIVISVWENEEKVREFAGDNWNDAVIPDGMEKFFTSCSLDHYVNIEV